MIDLSNAQDYKRLAIQIRQAIERYQFSQPTYGDDRLLQLPPYPKVEVVDDEIIIIGEDGDREIWCLRVTGEKELVEVVNPQLDEDQIEQLTSQIGQILQGDL